MSRYSVLVVDDEPLARRRIIRMLQKLDWIGKICEAGDVDEARSRALEDDPDILLLDIQMPGGDGFEVISRLPRRTPVVVFITALDHHALRAFDANAVDYITKPIEPGRFNLAMERAAAAASYRTQSERIVELDEALAALKYELKSQARRATEFWVKSDGEFLRIAAEDVVRFQADRDYVRLHVQGKDYLFQESLAELERRLDPSEFLRIHRGTIVRRGAIIRVKAGPFAALILVLSDNSEVRVGRTYTSTIRTQLSR